MDGNPGVTLQVNVAPSDLRYAMHTLPHQLRQWAGQVHEVLFTVDNRPSGRRTPATPEQVQALERLIGDLQARYPHVRSISIDYSPETVEEVSYTFFGGRRIPEKDFRGGPLFGYFYGLHAARHDHVLHADSDMMFGGGSQRWISEALAVLAARPEVLACSPLPGPPTADGSLRSQAADAEPGPGVAYRFQTLSTRVFLLDRRTLAKHRGSARIRWRRPFRSVLKALALGFSPYECAEEPISRMMRRRELFRVDLLGESPGMWSLHPAVRTEAYFRHLPELIRSVERGEVPEEQRGEHDLHEQTLEWVGTHGDAERPGVGASSWQVAE